MKEFIEYIARQLVDHPDQVTVTETLEKDATVYTVKVADPDIGKMIGKNGKMAYALRILTLAVGKKQGIKALFRLEERPKTKPSQPDKVGG